MKTETATFAAGCFWGVEELYRTLPGVISTRVGYTGGTVKHPTYKDVCSNTTGHAESVEIIYDPKKVSYQELLEIFWKNHNPTQLNYQGFDVGTQYRSVIFYHDEKQKTIAKQSKSALDQSGKYDKPVVTQIVPVDTFYEAEDYHQKYIMKKERGV